MTDNAHVAARAKLLRTHGKSSSRAAAEMLGHNSLLAASHAAQLCVSLRHHARRQAHREAVAERLNAQFANLPELELPSQREQCLHNWHKYVITTPQRDALHEHLKQAGIETQIHYPRLLPDETIFRRKQHRESGRARRHVTRCLTLPLHPHLSDIEVERLIDGVRSFCACGSPR